MRPGWKPTRRNKHAGTRAHGHGNDNKLSIPESWHESTCYYEKLIGYVVVRRTIGTRELLFFVEPTRPDWFYPCSVDDICAVLSNCSTEIVSAFDFIVLRQPTRKQRILRPVWGRAIFAFDLDKYMGSAIVLEAQSLASLQWPRSLGPESMRELERLRKDGHDIRNTRRGIDINVTSRSLRNTILYRTLLHELGHHVDYARSAEDEWKGKVQSQKEGFAHRFALELYMQLSERGVLPFDAIVEDDLILRDNLKREWFQLV